MPEKMYHATVCSNISRAYDKYQRTYDKAKISESTYANHFFLLPERDTAVGIAKATKLLQKLSYENDYVVVLETRTVDAKPNNFTGTGLGFYVEGTKIIVENVFKTDGGRLIKIPIEEVIADSYAILHAENVLCGYEQVMPRSISFLPIAIGCQASCPFCFSKSSVSIAQKQAKIPFEDIEPYFEEAKRLGATRAVITGGGEPTLLKSDEMVSYVASIKRFFDKIVLITNGYEYAKLDSPQRDERLKQLERNGLSVLAVSRHAASEDDNENIMHLRTGTARIMDAFQTNGFESLKLRLICVLQKGGVDSLEKMADYLDFAASQGVGEICFKELYVSTSKESMFYEKSGNLYSYQNQVPLSMAVNFCKENGFKKVHELPWGSPVYEGVWNAISMKIACYTEPSLFWEKKNRIARSWNLMSNGVCYASLEDINSIIKLEEV